jgi:toxin ParE1/3/4
MFRRPASEEMREAVAWYNTRKAGLGREFRLAVHHVIQGILVYPERWPVYCRSVRRAVVARFPYVVYYVRQDDTIRILRVVHTSQDPGPILDLLP